MSFTTQVQQQRAIEAAALENAKKNLVAFVYQKFPTLIVCDANSRMIVELTERWAGPDIVPTSEVFMSMLDENGKDVLWALVKLVEESCVAPQRSVGEAAAVYKFLRKIEWQVDRFDEKNELLRQCAIAGWRSVGIDPLDIGRR